MSYLQIKKFVDEQIKILNTPVKIDDNIKRLLSQENLPENQISSVLFKCNLLLKRQNRTKFNKQVVHQIVQQVAKAEQANLVKVNESLGRISQLVCPVMMDQFGGSGRLQDRIRLLNNLADILPEGRYLFALQEDVEDLSETPAGGENVTMGEGNTENTENTEIPEKERSSLVRDDAELLETAEDKELRKKYMDATKEAINKRVGAHQAKRAELRLRYDDLRASFARINEDLIYKMQKLEYLKNLNRKLDFSAGSAGENVEYECDSDGEDYKGDEIGVGGEISGGDEALGAQMSRFNVLVEKLEFALTPG